MAPSPTNALALSPAVPEAMALELSAAQVARETGLAACRRAVRYAGSAVRSVHGGDARRWEEMKGRSEDALREAQRALSAHPAVAYAGFLQDAEKEFSEAVLTRALVDDKALPTWHDLSVGLGPWLNGLCEAASELRRQVLDLLRRGEPGEAERLLGAMDSAYELLMGIDYPDAITAGLRRNTDALRAVLERTRSDLTTASLSLRLQVALDEATAMVGPA
jgi:translin